MPLLIYVITTKIALTFGLSLVYLYLYKQYKEKYIALWFTSWSLFAVHVFIELLRIRGIENFFLALMNQLISILSVWLLLYGTYSFRRKRITKYWIYSAIIVTFLSDILFLFQLPYYLCAIPTVLFFGAADIFVGVSFIRCWKIPGLGRIITGYALFILGFINSTYPAIQVLPIEYSVYFYFLGFLFEIIIMIGTLILYFQKIRKDLSDSEERFRLLAENAKDTIFKYNFSPNTGFEYISPAVFSLTGYFPDELSTNPQLLAAIIDTDIDTALKTLQLSQDLVKQFTRFSLTHKDGHKVWVEQHSTLIHDKFNNVVALEGIARDITERVRVENEIYRINQLKIMGETAASIAHEIRNPMTVIRGYLSNLVGKEALKNYSENFSLMIGELDRANKILSDYLSISKVSEYNPKSRNLNEIIQALQPLIESSTFNSKVKIDLTLGHISNVMVDENQIHQLLLNIVSNGLESMNYSGKLSIKTYTRNNKVVLSITDEGKGIDKNVLDKIGTPFFTTKDTGTGLGLAVCYRIAEQHNAEIFIDTSCTGTTFSIEFKVQGREQ